MSPVVIGLIGLAGLFLMIFLRVPIGIALAIAGVAGYAILSGIDTTLNLLGSIPFEIAYNYDLSIIALFVLMGNLAMVSGMSRDRALSSMHCSPRNRSASCSLPGFCPVFC